MEHYTAVKKWIQATHKMSDHYKNKTEWNRPDINIYSLNELHLYDFFKLAKQN